MDRLQELRGQFDQIDEEIIRWLKRRFELARQMRELKRQQGLPSVDLEREREILSRIAAAVDPADRDTAVGVYERIFSGSRGVVETIARGVCVCGGKVLLCRAKGGKSTYLPGGHIEFGETGSEALVREVREETGLDSVAGDFMGVVENSFWQHGERHCEINLVYRLQLQNSPESVRSREDWIEFVWQPVSALETAGLLPAAMNGIVARATE